MIEMQKKQDYNAIDEYEFDIYKKSSRITQWEIYDTTHLWLVPWQFSEYIQHFSVLSNQEYLFSS